jgi:hypothetical protein
MSGGNSTGYACWLIIALEGWRLPLVRKPENQKAFPTLTIALTTLVICTEWSNHDRARPIHSLGRAYHTPAQGVWPRLVAQSGPEFGQAISALNRAHIHVSKTIR